MNAGVLTAVFFCFLHEPTGPIVTGGSGKYMI